MIREATTPELRLTTFTAGGEISSRDKLPSPLMTTQSTISHEFTALTLATVLAKRLHYGPPGIEETLRLRIAKRGAHRPWARPVLKAGGLASTVGFDARVHLPGG